MEYKNKILQQQNRVNDIATSIDEFKSRRPASQADWKEGDVDKLLGMESKLRDARRSLNGVHKEIDKKFLTKDHRTGTYVRI